MTLPPVYFKIFWLFCLMQAVTITLDGFLCKLIESRRFFAALKAGFTNSPPNSYMYVVFVLLILAQIPRFPIVPIPEARVIAFGLMGLFSFAPLWGLRGLPRYFGCIESLALTICAYLWPEVALWRNGIRVLLISMVSYIVFFIAMMPLRRHGQKKSGSK